MKRNKMGKFVKGFNGAKVEKFCKICKSIFITNSGAQIYCEKCKTIKCFECKKQILKKTNFRPREKYFCSLSCGAKYYYKSHPELKDKLKKNLPRGEKHPSWKGGKDYRKKAFEYYGKRCSVCGYNKFENLLWVHHKDFQKRNINNNIKNLQVLCIRCHLEKHLLQL